MNQIKYEVFIGADVSKDSIDIYFNSESSKISNDEDSINTFLTIVQKFSLDQKVLCVVESTGGFEKLFYYKMLEAGIYAHRAHPNKVHSFANASGHFAKTDKLDAILLYKYAKFISETHEPDIVPDSVHLEIIELNKLLRSIQAKLHADQCRIKQVGKSCIKYLEKSIELHKEQIEAIYCEIKNKMDDHPDLKNKKDLMQSMKGVGEKSAMVLLAEIPELGKLGCKEIASLVGVAPKTYQSGKKYAKGKISGGRFYARKALYMCALVASRYDVNMKQKYEKFLAQGKPKKVALVALMREIIVILNSIIKNTTSYDVNFNGKRLTA